MDTNEEKVNANSLHKKFLGNDYKLQFSISFILKSSNHIIIFFFNIACFIIFLSL